MKKEKKEKKEKNEPKAQIMIVEDDKDISDVVTLLLTHAGYEVRQAGDGQTALMEVSDDLDLIILDVMLPGMSGIDICKEIRREYNTPILFLTAKSSDEDKSEGLMAGGDDYLTKPFSETELLARVMAIMRRYQVYKSKSETTGRETYITGGRIRLSEQFNAVWKNGREVDLTDIEYRILKLLMQNRNRIFPIKAIYEAIWDEPYFYSSNNTVMVHIRKLRKKIEDDPQDPKYIRTEWGRGYKFVSQE